MIEIIPTVASNVIGCKIIGKIETSDFEHVSSTAEEKLKKHQKLRVYTEIESLEGVSLEALVKNLQFTWQHFGDFEKEAIVSGEQWLEMLANISDRLFPSLEVRHFSPAQKDQALLWLES